MTIRIDVVRDPAQPEYPNPVDPKITPSHWFTAKIVEDREWQADTAHTWAFSNVTDLVSWLNDRLAVLQKANKNGVAAPLALPQSPAPVAGLVYAPGTVLPGYRQLADGTEVKV